MSISILIEGDTAGVVKAIDLIEAKLEPYRLAGFMKSVMEPFLSGRAEDRFKAEGDEASGKWAPLKPSTIRIRQALGYPPGPINVRTGDLEDYILHGGGQAVGIAGGGAQLRYPGTRSQSKKMIQAQRGGPRSAARPVLAVDQTDMAFFQEALGHYLESPL